MLNKSPRVVLKIKGKANQYCFEIKFQRKDRVVQVTPYSGGQRLVQRRSNPTTVVYNSIAALCLRNTLTSDQKVAVCSAVDRCSASETFLFDGQEPNSTTFNSTMATVEEPARSNSKTAGLGARFLYSFVRNDAMKSDPPEIYGWRVFALTCSACMGGMLFGMDTVRNLLLPNRLVCRCPNFDVRSKGIIGGVMVLPAFQK
jgi:hypothetical protein